MGNIRIPREIQIRYGIQPGAVFIIQRNNDKKEHYYVVLNHNPAIDNEIILVGATTKHYKGRLYNETRGYSEDTLVIIGEHQSQAIPKRSTFNCNRYIYRTIDHLCTSVDYKRIEYTGKVIEEDILKSLREAILRSPMLRGKHRRFIEGDH